MKEIKITNLVKFYTLLLLNEKPKYGYELIKEIEEKLNKKTSPGEIYPFMKKLEELGFIKSGKREERDKKVYHLTREGKVFVRNMLNRFGVLIDIAVEPRLTVCAHCGCKVYRNGYKEKINKREITFCCQYCAKSYKKELKYKGRKS